MAALPFSVSRVLRPRLIYFTRFSNVASNPDNSFNVQKDDSTNTQPSSSTGFTGVIPIEKIDVQYSRSSGPGGQHVNKTNSKATISFDMKDADWIPTPVRDLFAEKYGHRLTKAGRFQLQSERTRIASLNLADCLDKVRSALFECSKELEAAQRQPTAEQLEVLIKRKEKAARIKLAEKRANSFTKRSRKEEKLS